MLGAVQSSHKVHKVTTECNLSLLSINGCKMSHRNTDKQLFQEGQTDRQQGGEGGIACLFT